MLWPWSWSEVTEWCAGHVCETHSELVLPLLIDCCSPYLWVFCVWSLFCSAVLTSFLVLQSSPWGRENWLPYFIFVLAVTKFVHVTLEEDLIVNLEQGVWNLHSACWLINPLYTNGFFLLVWYNKFGIVHCTYLKVSAYNFLKILYFFVRGSFFTITNSVDLDEMLHYAAIHLGLHCL